MGNIYLVGFMGSGKTTIGKLLSRKLSREFVEMDDRIEQREGKRIVDIFKQDGEPFFRKLERELLRELSTQANLVISCGGGLICDQENLKVLKETGKVFALKVASKTIDERTKQYTHRPLLNVDHPLECIEELLKKREPYYNQAHYSIDTEGLRPEEVANQIIELIEKDG